MQTAPVFPCTPPRQEPEGGRQVSTLARARMQKSQHEDVAYPRDKHPGEASDFNGRPVPVSLEFYIVYFIVFGVLVYGVLGWEGLHVRWVEQCLFSVLFRFGFEHHWTTCRTDADKQESNRSLRKML
uniref:Uncharacterized protein n=1 Tax=Lotharella globosa TaxID=91324 RepID=A0A7S4DNR8_9EUKA